MTIAPLLLTFPLLVIGTLAQSTAPCPLIKVFGPPGIVGPKEISTFTAEFSRDIPADIRLFWHVTNGEILSGQNTVELKVRFPTFEQGVNVTATLEVVGLPKGCPNTFEETYSLIVHRVSPILVDEYTVISHSREIDRLRVAVNKLKEYQSSFLVIIAYLSIGQNSKPRVAQIRKILIKRLELQPNLFSIVIATDLHRHTKIFVVPPGTPMPEP